MARKTAREYAYKLIFETLFLGEESGITQDIFFEDTTLTDGDKEYIKKLVAGVVFHKESLMETLMKYTKGFTAERLFKADVAAMLLSLYELTYMADIPRSVSINECVEIVKAYGTEKSGNYVNGILANIFKELERGKQ